MQKLKITRTYNGYILEGEDLHHVIEEREPNEYELESNPEFAKMEYGSADEKVALRNLFLQISEYFGFIYDKYSKFNLKISFDNEGDHVEEGKQTI